MSGDEEIVSKRARKNYPGEVSFGALSKEENEHSVAQVSRCTDTGNCTWTEDGTKPQLLGGLGEEGGGGSSLQQMVVVVVVFTLKTVLTSIQYPSLSYSSRQRNEFPWSHANPK